jgi:hypothetical protein
MPRIASFTYRHARGPTTIGLRSGLVGDQAV